MTWDLTYGNALRDFIDQLKGRRQRWPPPAPGTHESDLDFDCPFTERNASAYRAHHAEYLIGFRWTRETKGTP